MFIISSIFHVEWGVVKAEYCLMLMKNYETKYFLSENSNLAGPICWNFPWKIILFKILHQPKRKRFLIFLVDSKCLQNERQFLLINIAQLLSEKLLLITSSVTISGGYGMRSIFIYSLLIRVYLNIEFVELVAHWCFLILSFLHQQFTPRPSRCIRLSVLVVYPI